MSTNFKGTLGEAKVLEHLVSNGLQVFKPFSDYCEIDFVIANSSMVLKRLQVKYRTLNNGRLIIPFDSIVNRKKISANLDHIDCWAIYCVTLNKIFYLTKEFILSSRNKDHAVYRLLQPKRNHPLNLPVVTLNENPHQLWNGQLTES